ncbi:hypothetical protein L584_09935 [Pantoea agglomerans Tx10]|nr:hypothetical protein L584_09935 [Pantoea agglomerans Tx10]KDA92498.1 hypothetical protein T296_22670 [Pantoea agglomerans Eh318]KEY44351.1 hypothetical protein FB99_28030 [Pantoea agglomerans]
MATLIYLFHCICQQDTLRGAIKSAFSMNKLDSNNIRYVVL